MRLKFIDKRMFAHIDWVLFANIIILVMLSLIAIASALSDPLDAETKSITSAIGQLDVRYVFQQLTWFAVGLVAMFVMLLPDYHNVLVSTISGYM